MVRDAGAVAMLLVLAACSKPGGTVEQQAQNEQAANATQAADDAGPMIPAEKAARAAASGANDNAPYYLKLQLKEFMPHVMQYAGDGIWKRQGFITDKTGEHSLFPKNDREWEDAESAARTLAEVTNVLLIPGRRVPDPNWDKAVLEVRKVALQAADAAERKDQDAWFKAGSDLDEACNVCHKQFDPTFKPGGR
ncbi:hypothetical protein [Sphingomonas sp. MMS24-J13]|uniref:hypothetical protein n=1 Tax=Sphingomonas sp. MMS24-J13 TaxID=3238686 RepID=UPI00384EA6C6